jgi:pimeloyl-ACP methyl ester carboxylesterase
MKSYKKIIYVTVSLLAIVATGFYVFFIFKNVETQSIGDQDRTGASGKFIKLTDGITHYEVAGPDTAKTVVLVHGFSVPYYIWDGTFDSLVQEGFRVIRYDAFGRGLSDKPEVEYNPHLYRRQLSELIQSLQVKTPFSIAGLSFGGAVVGDFVTHHPEMIDKVILVDPVYRFKNTDIAELVMNYSMAVKAEAMAGGQLEDFKYPELFPDWVSKYKNQMKFKGFRHSLISTIRNYPSDTIVANYTRLESLSKKVLLIWGKEDKTVTFDFSDSLRQKLQLDFLPVDDACHLPHLEKPLLVNSKIVSFLKNK